MTTKRLTDTAVKAAEPPTGTTASGRPKKGRVIRDEHTKGLELRISRGGVKSWAVRYRVNGRQRRLGLGRYPKVSLAKARGKAMSALGKASEGRDPAREKQEEERAAREAQADTFKGLAELYLDKYALGPDVGPRCHVRKRGSKPPVCEPHGEPLGHLLDADGEPCDVWSFSVETGEPGKRTWSEDRRKLEVEIRPAFGDRTPVSEIGPEDVLRLVDSIVDRGHTTQARRVLALVSKVFNFAKGRRLVRFNPAAGVDKPGKEQSRDRHLDDDEIRQLWKATGEMENKQMAARFRLMLLTGQRLGEIRNMRWSEIDLEERVWTLPGSRTKNGRTHRVPLSDAAMEIITGLPQFDRHVLAGARGNRQFYKAADEIGLSDFQPGRDLRTTALTRMTASGVSRFDAGQVLNHSAKSVTGVHYDRYEYDREKRRALDTLAGAIGAVLEDDAGKVVAFAKGA